MALLEEARREKAYLIGMLKQYKRLANIAEEGELWTRKKNNIYREYYLKLPGEKKKYLGEKDNVKLLRMKMKYWGTEGVKLVERNIKRIDELIESYEDCYMSDVIRSIPEEYRVADYCIEDFKSLGMRKKVRQSEDPNYREGLIHVTSFGLFVRSKNEVMIAEELNANGIGFDYEKALTLKIDSVGNMITVYPDFTIYLPRGQQKFWEHKGKYLNKEYREQDNRKMLTYYLNGIYQPRNLIVTMDGPNGEFNVKDIRQIVGTMKQEITEYRD